MDEEKNNTNKIKSLHTLEGDLLASMKDENYGSNIVKIVTQGKSAASGLSDTQDSISERNPNLKKYILASVSIVFGISAILFYTFNISSKENKAEDNSNILNPNIPLAATTTSEIQSRTIFEADVIVPIKISNGNKNDLIQTLQNTERELVAKKAANSLNITYLLDTDLENLFNKLQYSGPDSLIRSFSTDQAYNFGVYHVKESEFEKYLLIKIGIFDLGFSGMLGWEKTLPIDMERIFTYTTLSTSSTSTPKFVDKIIKNIDTRTYIDPQKGVRITYGFINREYVLITSGETAFADIVNKLLVNNILR